MGRVGFLYESMKDEIKWKGLSPKHYIKIVSKIGYILSMEEKEYQKEKVSKEQMSDSAISEVFLKAFGDGK